MPKPESILTTDEVRAARFGPRDLKDPRSRAYAIQTLYSLKRWIESEEIEQRRIEKELATIRAYKHWAVLGYPSEDELLKAEVGLSRKQLVAKMAEKTVKLQNQGRPKKENKGYNVTFKRGNSAKYLTALIARDHKQIHARMKRGEFKSVRAAAIEAGIITPPTILDQLMRLWDKASATTRRDFLSHIKVSSKHIGSSFDDFLKEEGTFEATTTQAMKRDKRVKRVKAGKGD